MNDAEKLLRRWKQSPPRDGADCQDARKVMEFLGMTVVENNEGHYEATHAVLRDHPRFPLGRITVNCHAKGRQGQAHPAAIREILIVAKAIEAAEAREAAEAEEDE